MQGAIPKMKVHIIGLHEYKIMENTNKSIVTERRSVDLLLTWTEGRGWVGKIDYKGDEEILGVQIVHYLDSGDGFMGQCGSVSQRTDQRVLRRQRSRDLQQCRDLQKSEQETQDC